MFGKPGKRVRATAFGIVSMSACVLLAACSPVKMGSAALVGGQRITQSELDTQVSNLQTAAEPYGKAVTLHPAELPGTVLTWLIKFQIGNQVSAANGISVTQAQIQAGKANINAQAQQAAQQNSLPSPQAALLEAGIPPQLLTDLGKFQAQELAYAVKVNGGKLPTTQQEGNAVNAKLAKAQCTAAKSLNIQVNPQFGRMDYSQLVVVPSTDTLSQLAGTPSPANTTGVTPAC